MAFKQVLEKLVGDRQATLLDMHKAFSIVATLYVEDSLNLVNEAISSGTNAAPVLAHADEIFIAWEKEISSLKSAIQQAVRSPPAGKSRGRSPK